MTGQSIGQRREVAVQALERGGGAVAVERAHLDGGPQAAGRRRSPKPVADDVADREEHPPVAPRDHVVPVASDAEGLAPGSVPGGERHLADPRQLRGEEAALQRLRGRPLATVAFALAAYGYLGFARELLHRT